MPLNRQPEFFQMNDEQTLMIISSAEDGVYIDMLKRLKELGVAAAEGSKAHERLVFCGRYSAKAVHELTE